MQVFRHTSEGASIGTGRVKDNEGRFDFLTLRNLRESGAEPSRYFAMKF